METLLDLALGLLRLGVEGRSDSWTFPVSWNEYRTCLLEANLEGCSWPVFPLKHHMLVWMAARRVVGLVPLTNYAILGDDIVPMRKWQYTRHSLVCILTLSPDKSLISKSSSVKILLTLCYSVATPMFGLIRDKVERLRLSMTYRRRGGFH